MSTPVDTINTYVRAPQVDAWPCSERLRLLMLFSKRKTLSLIHI
jgi:hypothetical protein